MKNIFLLMSVFFCWSCSQPEGFIVRGKIDNYSGSMLFVREMIPDNEAWFNDTLKVLNGEFVYRGKVESPRLVYLVPQDYQGRCELFLENSGIELNIKNGDFANARVEGSAAHDEYVAVKQKSADLQSEFRHFEYRRNQAFKEDKELYRQLSDSTEIWTSRFLAFLMEQPNYSQSMVLPYFASEWIKSDDVHHMERFLSGLNEEVLNSTYAQHCAEAVTQAKKVLPGMPAYDFTLRDTSGNIYQLKDFRGEYVLLEFSASWCGWCKLEVPYLKQVYGQAQGKKFRMFTINLDKERQLWMEDVAKEALPWPVISDLKAFKHGVAEEYNVTGIPVIFLIDPEGKIVTNKLRGEEMVRYVGQLLNQ